MGADEPVVGEPTSTMEANGSLATKVDEESTKASNITAQASEDKKDEADKAEEIVAGSKKMLNLDTLVKTPNKQRPPALDSAEGDLASAALPTPTGSSMPSTPAPAAPPPVLGAEPSAVPEPPQAPPSKVPDVVPGAKPPSLSEAVPPPSPAAMAAVQGPGAASPAWGGVPGMPGSSPGQGYWTDPATQMPYPSPTQHGYWPMSPGHQLVPPSPHQAASGAPGQVPPPPSYAAPAYAAPSMATAQALLPSQPEAASAGQASDSATSPIKTASALGLRADAHEFVMPTTVPPPAQVPQARPHISILPETDLQPVAPAIPVTPAIPPVPISPSNTKGMSPRSALLSLCGAWGALSGNIAEATAIRNASDIPNPVSREDMLKYRQAVGLANGAKEMETMKVRDEYKLLEGDESQSPIKSPRRGGKGKQKGGKGKQKKNDA